MKPLVYLDHHIKRDNLLYERSGVKHEEKGKLHPTLTIRELNGGEDSKRYMLRKPDFQRATCAWSPEECVDLLEAVLKERVVPSIILWFSPQGLHYVLDGGHRISVLLAWITNDWGDGTLMVNIDDAELRERARQSAKDVRRLLQLRNIGSYEEYREAFRAYTQIERDGGDAEAELGTRQAEMGVAFRRWRSVEIGFPILWVHGDYITAEESFIKINKTGQRLTEWETKVAPYVAELLTVIDGRRGMTSDTEELLKKTKGPDAASQIEAGSQLLKEIDDAIEHLYGTTSRSLLLMPLVDFYNEEGSCIRALLYGFLHWISNGLDREIHTRKLSFSAHQARFESVVLEYKYELVRRISRRIGSGPEVTIQVGRYYDGLLDILEKNVGQTEAESFKVAHARLLEDLKRPKEVDVTAQPVRFEGEQPRMFRGKDRQKVRIKDLVNSFPLCQICGGRFHPGLATQVDHILRHRDGGATTSDNGRSVHPFCNNNRDKIEKLRVGALDLKKPEYTPGRLEGSGGPQLTFLSALFQNESEPLWWTEEGVADESDQDSDPETTSLL